MSYTGVTLKRIIQESFDDSQISLAKASGLLTSAISKICRGQQSLTPEKLKALCTILSKEDAQVLCLATCRDLLPDEYAQDINLEEAPTSIVSERTMPFNMLDDHTEEIFRRLRILVMKDRESLEWLHTTAQWIFPDMTEIKTNEAELESAVKDFLNPPKDAPEDDQKSQA